MDATEEFIFKLLMSFNIPKFNLLFLREGTLLC